MIDHDFFAGQILRLKSVWEKDYPTERAKLIYTAIKEMSESWLEAFVNNAIGNSRKAPLLVDFMNDATDTRRRELATNSQGNIVQMFEKAAERAPNREFFTACKELLGKKASGQVTLEEFHQGCDLLDQAAHQLCPQVCRDCNGDGYVYRSVAGYQTMFRCDCKIGSSRPSEIQQVRHHKPNLISIGREKATGEKEEKDE